MFGAPFLVTPRATRVGARVIAGDWRVPELSTVAVANADCASSGFDCSAGPGAGCAASGFTCSAGAGAGSCGIALVLVSSDIYVAPGLGLTCSRKD